MSKKTNTQLLIEAAQRGDAAEVQRLIPVSNPKYNRSQALLLAANDGHTKCVKLLIPVSEPKAGDSHALRWATGSEHAECVKLLIPVSDPKEQKSGALRWAALRGHTDCVDVLFDVSDADYVLHQLQTQYSDDSRAWEYLEAQRQRDMLYDETIHVSQCPLKVFEKSDTIEQPLFLNQRYMNTSKNTNLLIRAAESGNATEVQRLIPMSDPKENDSKALRMAAYHGQTECVTLLIPVSEPKSNNSEALFVAAYHGRADCVQLLIPVSAPKDEESRALRWAALRGHTDCVDVLFDVSDAHSVLSTLQDTYPKQPEFWTHLDEKVNKKQRDMLNNEIAQQSVQPCVKNTCKI